MEKAKIAVLVSGGGTNLQAIIDAQAKGLIKSGAVELVISDTAGAFALERAAKAGIRGAVIPKKEVDFETKLIKLLESEKIDYIVLAGFLSILSEAFVKKYDHRIINIHPSLIPSFCGKGYYGLKVHEAVIAKGVKVTGATVHFVNEIPDGGDIIMQKAVAVEEGDTPKSLQQRVMEEAEWVILPQAVELVCSERK